MESIKGYYPCYERKTPIKDPEDDVHGTYQDMGEIEITIRNYTLLSSPSEGKTLLHLEKYEKGTYKHFTAAPFVTYKGEVSEFLNKVYKHLYRSMQDISECDYFTNDTEICIMEWRKHSVTQLKHLMYYLEFFVVPKDLFDGKLVEA